MTLRGLALLALLAACARPSATIAQLPAVPDTPVGEWINLQRATEWRGYQSDTLPSSWQFDAASGVLTFSARGGGDIVTRRRFSNFELELEWRVGPRGNSGIFYWANEHTPRIYENAPEMQVLDNTGHADGKNTLTSAGANYALYAPVQDVTRPVGEWNRVRIVTMGNRVEHWLNGVKVVEYEAGSADWMRRGLSSKFAAWNEYGVARRGHIGLQDHGDVVSFRNIRIREVRP